MPYHSNCSVMVYYAGMQVSKNKDNALIYKLYLFL